MTNNRNKVIFANFTTPDHDKAIGHARYVINATTGIGMELLMEVVKNNIPIVDDEGVFTDKRIIYTSRYECPCCNTNLLALISVNCHGQYSSKWKEVGGLYRVSIDPEKGACNVKVEKLSGEVIHQGRTNGYLPQKDYNADPDAKKEIENRNEMINNLVANSGGKAIRISGIETAEDMQNMVKAAVKTFGDEKNNSQ